MLKKTFYIIFIELLLISFSTYSESKITFDEQGWTSDQSLDTIFTIGNYTFLSNKHMYTNYGYNFDVNNVSIYYAFQNPGTDQIIIKTSNNQLVDFSSFAAYQVSETSSDTLIVEGWEGNNKKYSKIFPNNNSWKILSLDYKNINKIIIRIGNLRTGYLFDYNFDNFSFNNSPLPVELTSFTGKVVNNKIELNWQTATELNNSGFEVQRKISNHKDADWEKIGFVAGNGNTNSTKYYSYVDTYPTGGNKFQYRLKQIDTDGTSKFSEIIEIEFTPNKFELSQNYPNPFNPSTTIKYSLSEISNVILKVYDILGNEVATLIDERKEVGSYSVTFDAGNLSSGIYIYKLVTDAFVSTKKMILIK